MRISIHVHPGSRRPGVGGTHGGSLVVRVAERATDGRATAAACAAVAAAFGVRARDVVLVTGATSRNKVIDLTAGHEDVIRARLDELFEASDGGSGRH